MEFKSYTFYEDPGHGWLQVPKKDITELNIQDDISDYSFVDDDNVYLEEDCDVAIFIRAWSLKFPNEDFDLHSNSRYEENSFIRNLKYYTGL